MTALAKKLFTRFGFSSFRPWQQEAIEELLSGKQRVLVVAPTGGGKSLCYQFPATELPGTTLVVSPLIALMEDQVRSLAARGIEATWLSSTLTNEERRVRWRQIRDHQYKLVYLAPERLALPGIIGELRQLETPLLAIDEAHCISQWGHDFRPDYLRLRGVIEALRPPRVLACTATATPLVRQEILSLLGLGPDNTATVLRGFARPNLHLAVHEIDQAQQRRRLMVAVLRDVVGSPTAPQGAAIVYAATRRNVEKVAQSIQDLGYRAAGYHGGLDPDLRARVNEGFASRALDVVVATNAFGMGIDRADIRGVIHIQAPGSVEEYYQEVGRAGRDGEPAQGVLIASSADLGLRRRLIELGTRTVGGRPDGGHVARQWQLFLDLLRYVEAGSCRHDFILRYFGDESEALGGCGHCDVCRQLDQGGPRELSEAEARERDVIVRKALAGVARTRQRVGLTAVADMLCGAKTAQQKRLGFSSLTTFGLLQEHPKPWVQALLRRLVSAGLADLSGDEYPLASLTAAGWQAMKGDAPVRVVLPSNGAGASRASAAAPRRKKRKSKAAAPIGLSVEEETLFEQLRLRRLELARSKGVAPFKIAHNRTLQDMAARRPSTMDELALVYGMGPARLGSYGEAFLEVLLQF
jgi:ATP-dependent DNA helicase RecQ